MSDRIYVLAALIFLGCNQPSAGEKPSAEPEKPVVAVDPAQEATLEVSRMFDLMAKHYKEEHPGGDGFIGDDGLVVDMALHQCAHPEGNPSGGESGVIPPLSVTCSAGPDGKCVPTDNPSQPFEYAKSAWGSNAMFAALGFSQDQPHRFHYGVRAVNEITGYGRCQFTVQAFGDLDGDSVFSTYERSGAADQAGVNAAVEMYLDKPGE